MDLCLLVISSIRLLIFKIPFYNRNIVLFIFKLTWLMYLIRLSKEDMMELLISIGSGMITKPDSGTLLESIGLVSTYKQKHFVIQVSGSASYKTMFSRPFSSENTCTKSGVWLLFTIRSVGWYTLTFDFVMLYGLSLFKFTLEIGIFVETFFLSNLTSRLA